MVELDARDVQARLRGTALDGETPRRLDAGMDSVAWKVGGHVVRVPRRAEGAACLADELRWLPRIAPHLDLRVPVSDVVVPPDDTFPCYIGGYPMIRGATADRAHADGLDDVGVARRLALGLADLYALRIDEDGAPVDRWRKNDLAFRLGDIDRRLRRAVEDEALTATAARRCLRVAEGWAQAEPADPAGACWVHGDLHPRRVIVDEGVLAGVIDWGDLHLGDPAVDLSLAWTLFVGAARDALLDPLVVDGDMLSRAKLRALYYGLVFVSYGADVGDPAFVRTGHRTLAALELT